MPQKQGRRLSSTLGAANILADSDVLTLWFWDKLDRANFCKLFRALRYWGVNNCRKKKLHSNDSHWAALSKLVGKMVVLWIRRMIGLNEILVRIASKNSEVWSGFFRKLPNFSDSYRIFPTVTEFNRQLPNFTDCDRFFSTKNDRFLRSYLRTAASCLRTSPPLSPTPRSRPPIPRSRPPILPCRPRRAQPATAGHLHETTEFHRQS